MTEGRAYEIPSDDYEQACLREVRETLAKVDANHSHIELKSVQLHRDGDDRRITAVVVRRGRRDTLEWQLYEDVFSGTTPPGKAEPPSGVAQQMMVWALGG